MAIGIEANAPVAPRVRRGRWLDSAWATRLWQLLATLGVLGVWQLVSTQGWVDPVISRTPAQVFGYLKTAAGNGELWTNTVDTMAAVFISLILAAVVGVIGGVALGLLPRVERVVSPMLDALNAMPRIALAPVFIVWLGIGIEAKVALAFSVVVFVILSSARAGVHAADPEVIRFSQIMGATKVQLFFKVLLPVSVPSIFAGLRLGLVYAMLGVIGSELIASQSGLGQRIAYYSGTYELQNVYGVLIVLALIATVLNILMGAIERWLLRWQAPTSAGAH